MTIEITRAGKVIHRSRNLRGLITHASRVGVRSVLVCRNPAYGADAIVAYRDGAECRTEFADFTIARDFFRARAGRWGLREKESNPDRDDAGFSGADT